VKDLGRLSCSRLAVVARLHRAIQYAETAVIDQRGRGVLDAPVKPGHDSGMGGRSCALLTHPPITKMAMISAPYHHIKGAIAADELAQVPQPRARTHCLPPISA
ncbi:hypothetical protein, partial [Bradyrhizobium cajani]|uniref:hypothetical protein n=1 Tax=Bradyrhizobium cajani TaxID=1928661 RepID=UPI00197A8296